MPITRWDAVFHGFQGAVKHRVFAQIACFKLCKSRYAINCSAHGPRGDPCLDRLRVLFSRLLIL
jgi:hypothetical protein